MIVACLALTAVSVVVVSEFQQRRTSEFFETLVDDNLEQAPTIVRLAWHEAGTYGGKGCPVTGSSVAAWNQARSGAPAAAGVGSFVVPSRPCATPSPFEPASSRPSPAFP